MEIAEFLLARIAEDEAGARAATAGSWEVCPYWFTSEDRSWATVPDVINEDIDAEDAEHIARWGPARVLAECDAKRRIVAEAQDALAVGQRMVADDAWSGRENAYEEVLQCLALPYADHADYRQEWKP